MKKNYRIRKNEEFSKIIEKRHSIADECFVVYFDLKKEEYSRVGISVSKKLGDAVTRNWIKRQIRMMLANTYDFNSELYDLIIIARKPFLDKSYEDKRNQLEKLIKKAIINKWVQGEIYE